MVFQKDELDLVLVPIGLVIMLGYHLFFLYRYLHHPETTVLGIENADKRTWVDGILQIALSDRTVGTSIMSSNITASTFLSSVCLTLCSLLGAWLSNSSTSFVAGLFIYGNTRPSITEIKQLCLLICFILAFTCFLEAARQFVHSSFLVGTPLTTVDVSDLKFTVVRAGEYWALGLRALYVALNLLMWFFGPIPMFVSSVVLVAILQHHDMHPIPHRKSSTQKSRSGSEVASSTVQ